MPNKKSSSKSTLQVPLYLAKKEKTRSAVHNFVLRTCQVERFFLQPMLYRRFDRTRQTGKTMQKSWYFTKLEYPVKTKEVTIPWANEKTWLMTCINMSVYIVENTCRYVDTRAQLWPTTKDFYLAWTQSIQKQACYDFKSKVYPISPISKYHFFCEAHQTQTQN